MAIFDGWMKISGVQQAFCYFCNPTYSVLHLQLEFIHHVLLGYPKAPVETGWVNGHHMNGIITYQELMLARKYQMMYQDWEEQSSVASQQGIWWHTLHLSQRQKEWRPPWFYGNEPSGSQLYYVLLAMCVYQCGNNVTPQKTHRHITIQRK